MSRFVLTAQLQLQAPNNVAQVVRQIQSQLNNINVNLNIPNAARTQRQLQQITTQTQAASSAADRMGRAFALSVRRFAAFSIATRAVGLFTSSLSKAVQTAIDFERELVKISQVTGESIPKLKTLTNVVTQLSTSLGVSSSSLIGVGRILSQAGFKADDLTIALKTLAKTELAPTFDDINQTAEGAIAIFNQFGQGAAALERQLGAINAVAGKFAVEAGDLIDVVRRAGGVFKASGGDLNELIALFTSVRATTRESAESIGTGLRTIFTRIQRPKTIKFLKEFGVELVDLENKFVGPFEAVKRLSAALSGLGEGDITFIRIAEELGGFRQIGKVLPLLQQFTVAQEALNVANKAGNSLADDAAKAQASLAVRIMKVKEEFLALIRGMTETKTFQIMANTALSLAEALIKIGEAIKPLLPLLAAVAAVNFAKGIGTFAGGLMRGMQSGRTYSTGGKVHHFARGGMVPGTGNRDTVPAMLQPGEFVIKKSSVNKLGAGNLAAMNENRYAQGGPTQAKQMGMSTADVLSAARRSITLPRFAKESSVGIATTSYLPSPAGGNISFKRDDLLNQVPGGTGVSLANKFGTKEAKDALAQIFKGKASFNYATVIEGVGKDEESKFATIINDSISTAIDTSASRFANEIMGAPLTGTISKLPSFYSTLDQGFRGQLFENTISALAGKPLSGQDSRRPLDFTRGIGKFKSIYSNLNMDYVDAKITSGASGLGKSGELVSKGIKALQNKAAQQLALESFPFVERITPPRTAEQRSSDSLKRAVAKSKLGKNLGGIIQKFNAGGVAKVKAAKFSSFRDIEKFMDDMWIRGIQEERRRRFAKDKSILRDSDSWNFKHPLIGSVSLTGQETSDLYAYLESQKRTLLKKQGFKSDPTEAIMDYKNNSSDINSALADKKISKDQKKQINALKKVSTDKLPKTLYSGIGLNRTSIIQNQVGKNFLQAIGKNFALPGFLSTSSDIGVAKTFGNGLFLRIATNAARKGIAADKHIPNNEYSHEKEFILPPNSRFRINRFAKNTLDIAQLNKGGVARFATGGGVGTDTVPALLTPGEFVVNKKSAQAIGYGSLNRMNKVGKYASGGVVQRFATGTKGSGVKSSGGGDIPFQLIALPGMKKLDATLFALDKVLFGAIGKLGIPLENLASRLRGAETQTQTYNRQILSINSILGSVGVDFGKILAENNAANKRTKAQQLELVDVIATHIKSIKDSGASQKEVRKAAFHYAKFLEQNTAQLKSGASLPALAATTPTASVPAPAASTGLRRRQPGTQPVAPLQGPATSATASATQSNTQAITQNTKAQKSAAGSAMQVVNNNKMFAASMATSLIAGFLPAVDENSGAMLKLTHSALGLVTTIASVGFALEAFGIKLQKQTVMDFLGGKGNLGNKLTEKMGLNKLAIGQRAKFLTPANATSAQRFGALKQAATESKAGFGFTGQGVGKFTAGLGKATQGLAKLAGPLVAIAGSAYLVTKAFGTVIESVYNFEGRLKTAIEGGDVEEAKKVAGERAVFEGANTVRAGGATAGAAIGFVLGGPVGAAIGAALGAGVATLATSAISAIFGEAGDRFIAGIGTLFGGNTYDSAVALAAAQAGAVKTQKQLEKAQKTATNAMEDFERGSISAAEALAQIRAATSEVVEQEKRASDFAQENTKNRGGMFRDIVTLGGLLGESSSVRNERLGKESAEQIRKAAKFQTEAFAMEAPARSANIRSGLARGKSVEEVRNEALGVGTKGDLQKRLAEQAALASTLQDKGDKQGAAAARESVNALTEQINQVNREIANLEKEVARSKAAFEAMNLGLRGASATANAMSASMDRFMAGLQVGGSTFVANAEFLSTAMTSAAQAMNPDEIKEAISDVSKNLKDMGVSGTAISKFEANTNAFVKAQQNYGKAFDKIRADADERRKRGQGDLSPDDLKKAFAAELTEGLGDEAKKNLTAIIENMELSNTEVDAILGGNMEIFGDKLSEAGQKQFETIMKIAQERQKAEQVVIQLIQQRAEAERNLAQAQKDAIDLYMEGRDVQAKYGGQAVSMEERRASILAKANAGGGRAGLAEMRTGSVAELRQRNMQTLAGFARIETNRSVEGGMAGKKGVESDITQKDLQQAQKDQIQTIRDLIKLEEEELKIIQEKNKLEKSALESLISGDIDQFFEQQAAMGAQAAIATGDRDAANLFGAKAVADAFKDIQRQQEAGVQTLFGRQLGGPGGLAEQAAGAALASRGVMDPRMAQRLAGTTAEEEASKARLRDLGGMLGETGAIGQAMAEMQVQTAEINVSNAEIKLSSIEERGREAAAGLARGGIVYANRGIFVPRGTDTVPAMLTPGEFVVRREAVNRGNNLQLLHAINEGGNAGGFARGGKIGYYNNGGKVQYRQEGGSIQNTGQLIDPQLITNLSNAFNSFISGFNQSIQNLKDTKLQIKLDSVNVNVNFTGTSVLTQISDETRRKVIDEVVQKMKNEYGVGGDGKLTENKGLLARPGQGS